MSLICYESFTCWDQTGTTGTENFVQTNGKAAMQPELAKDNLRSGAITLI